MLTDLIHPVCVMAGACVGTMAGVKQAKEKKANFIDSIMYPLTSATLGAVVGSLTTFAAFAAVNCITATVQVAKEAMNCLSQEDSQPCLGTTLKDNMLVLLPAAVVVTGVAANIFYSCSKSENKERTV